METTADQIKRIEEKIQLLLKDYALSQKEVQRLQKENQKLQEELGIQSNKVKLLEQKADASKLNVSGLSEKSKKDLEKRINTYLKDIDKCLALLHS